MDVKAMARSKRSHTKHHQPRKAHRPSTHSTTSSSSSSKDVLKEEGERKRSNPGSSLPSNLDRYYDSDEEEGLFGSDSESAGGLAPDATKTDVVKPKSKGADFRFLISQAMSQSPTNFTDSFDGVLPDFSQGLGSMLSVRGENILSWTGGHDFLMEDEATTNQEVSLLSLNLHALWEELARISLAQRLFIEEDILPPELLVSQKNDRDGKMTVSTSLEQSSVVDDLVPGSSKVERKIVSKEGCSLRSDSADTMRSDSADTSDGHPLPFRQEKQLDDIVAAHKADSLGILDPKKSFKASQEAELDNKMPGFEAKAAEAELDMLLDSFNEEKFFDSSSKMDSNVSSEVIKEKCSASLIPIGGSLTDGAPPHNSAHLDISRSSFPATYMDNDIDDLLQETTKCAVGHAISHSTDVNADSICKQLPSALRPGTKSQVMEDFDSWLDTI